MNCEFCQRVFSVKSALIRHKNTAKFCLKLQSDYNSKLNICNFCNKELTSDRNLALHYKTCEKYLTQTFTTLQLTEKLREREQEMFKKLREKDEELARRLRERDLEVSELKMHICKLEDKLENIAIKGALKPTTTTTSKITNYIQQLQPVTEAHFLECSSNLTIDHIKKGPRGYAQYALEYPLRDRVVCVDYARRKIKFKDSDGNIITDPEMNRLAMLFYNSIKDKNRQLVDECKRQLKVNFDDEELDMLSKLMDYMNSVERGSEGEKSDFQCEVLKDVCGNTVVEDV
jgi:hypothetical protein